MREQATSEQEEEDVSNNDTMTGTIVGLFDGQRRSKARPGEQMGEQIARSKNGRKFLSRAKIKERDNGDTHSITALIDIARHDTV